MFRTKKYRPGEAAAFFGMYFLGMQDLENSANPFGSSRDVISSPGATSDSERHHASISDHQRGTLLTEEYIQNV